MTCLGVHVERCASNERYRGTETASKAICRCYPRCYPRPFRAASSSRIYASELRLSCGAEGNRTPDPFHAMEVLCQLSYSPESGT